MVDFVLQSLCQQTLRSDLKRFSRPVLGAYPDLCRALHLFGIVGDAQAPFFLNNSTLLGKDFGIDDNHERMSLFIVLPTAQIDHRQLERYPYLVGRESDSRRSMHCL